LVNSALPLESEFIAYTITNIPIGFEGEGEAANEIREGLTGLAESAASATAKWADALVTKAVLRAGAGVCSQIELGEDLPCLFFLVCYCI
jgi:hypothetical protein